MTYDTQQGASVVNRAGSEVLWGLSPTPQRGFHGDYHPSRGNPGKRAPASAEGLLCA
ncbi:hypothetical protein LEMLEM_LOCUS9169 [Lemmus lemmus]